MKAGQFRAVLGSEVGMLEAGQALVPKEEFPQGGIDRQFADCLELFLGAQANVAAIRVLFHFPELGANFAHYFFKPGFFRLSGGKPGLDLIFTCSRHLSSINDVGVNCHKL